MFSYRLSKCMVSDLAIFASRSSSQHVLCTAHVQIPSTYCTEERVQAELSLVAKAVSYASYRALWSASSGSFFPEGHPASPSVVCILKVRLPYCQNNRIFRYVQITKKKKNPYFIQNRAEQLRVTNNKHIKGNCCHNFPVQS